jgi:hypothetical protein
MDRVLLSIVAKEKGVKDVTWEFGGSIGEAISQEKRMELMKAYAEILHDEFERWDREATKFN